MHKVHKHLQENLLGYISDRLMILYKSFILVVTCLKVENWRLLCYFLGYNQYYQGVLRETLEDLDWLRLSFKFTELKQGI